MRIYSVESKSLFFVNFIDFKVRVFSPREIMYSLLGAWLLITALQGNVTAVAGLLGAVVLLFGYIPYSFLPPEIQLINFLRFHVQGNNTSKKMKKEHAMFVGIGDGQPVLTNASGDKADDTDQDTDGPETIKIASLDEPYTITLKTSTTERFVPVLISVDGMPLANTSTDRKGNVSCTMLIDTYGTKRFCATDESGAVVYDRDVRFVP